MGEAAIKGDRADADLLAAVAAGKPLASVQNEQVQFFIKIQRYSSHANAGRQISNMITSQWAKRPLFSSLRYPDFL